MKLILARHGETTWNLEKKFYGAADISLDDKGFRQADHLAKILKRDQFDFDIGYCSSLQRTYQTIKPCLPSNVEIREMSGLNEKAFGAWEGMDADSIQANYPQSWQKWLDRPFDFVPPQAEDFYTFKHRVETTIDQIISDPVPKNILLVAHLGTLRVIDQYLLNDKSVFWDIKFNAGTYTEFVGTKNDFSVSKRNVK